MLNEKFGKVICLYTRVKDSIRTKTAKCTNSPDWSPYIFLKNEPREFVYKSKHFPYHNLFPRLCIFIACFADRLDYQPLFGKMSQHSSPEREGRIKDRTRETAEIEPTSQIASALYRQYRALYLYLYLLTKDLDQNPSYNNVKTLDSPKKRLKSLRQSHLSHDQAAIRRPRSETINGLQSRPAHHIFWILANPLTLSKGQECLRYSIHMWCHKLLLLCHWNHVQREYSQSCHTERQLQRGELQVCKVLTGLRTKNMEFIHI